MARYLLLTVASVFLLLACQSPPGDTGQPTQPKTAATRPAPPLSSVAPATRAAQTQRALKPPRKDGACRVINGKPKDGLPYQLYLSKQASKDDPDRLFFWMMPSGGMGDSSKLAPQLAQHHYALLIFAEPMAVMWSDEMIAKFEKSMKQLETVEGLEPRRPVVAGLSAYGQVAMSLYYQAPEFFGGIVLSGAYPARYEPVPGEPGRVHLVFPGPADGPAGVKVPILAWAGDRDPGTPIWSVVEPKWRAADAPLTLTVLPGRAHAWHLYPETEPQFFQWLDEVAAGRLPKNPGVNHWPASMTQPASRPATTRPRTPAATRPASSRPAFNW